MDYGSRNVCEKYPLPGQTQHQLARGPQCLLCVQCCALHEVLGVPSGITLVLLEVLSLLHLTSITSLLEFYYLSSTAGMTLLLYLSFTTCRLLLA